MHRAKQRIVRSDRFTMIVCAAVNSGLLFCLSGCSDTAAPPAAETKEEVSVATSEVELAQESSEFAPTHRLSSEANYYTTGPQQGRPADGTLPEGTQVEVLESAGTYALVRAESGEQGYVSQDVLLALEKGDDTDAGESKQVEK